MGASLNRFRVGLAFRISNFDRWLKTRRIQRRVTRSLSVRHDNVPPTVNPFVVLSTERSGSNFLMERLASNWTCIRSDGEIFNPARKSTFDEALKRTYFMDTGHTFVGSKVHPTQVSDSEVEEILAIRGMRAVILRRENVLRQCVSLRIAKTDRVWIQPSHSKRSDVSSRAVHIDTEELLEYERFLVAAYERFTSHTCSVPVARVSYEEMMTDPDATIRRIGEFLGAGPPDRSVPSWLLRQNPEPLRDLIVNSIELRDALLSGGHEGLASMMDS